MNEELTEEQWEYIIERYRWLCGEQYAQALTKAMQFQSGMKEIQSMTGYSQEHMAEISQALLNMAKEGTDG